MAYKDMPMCIVELYSFGSMHNISRDSVICYIPLPESAIPAPANQGLMATKKNTFFSEITQVVSSIIRKGLQHYI